MDDDVIRIMVSTDNHLGYNERDPIRCDDSFAAFEEVLRAAYERKVDFCLLAGDMFHENKPSRRTLHSTMELLRKYCLGDSPVYTQILNDLDNEIFSTSSMFSKANYEDPYQSIGLPIFSIHGNHDDPSREGGNGDALAALDLLAVTNLINYFGKADNIEDIEITPVLIRKGGTNIALYGLGAMRDDRLNRMWNQKKVRFVRLTAEQGRDDFFNIFLIHQNRDTGRGKKSCVHESMIPEWMDLVIWGNEHECQPNLAESLVGTYRILQPGSSIATSLSYSESSAFPKHMAFFEIKKKKFRISPIPYRQNRVFMYEDLCLKDEQHDLNPNDPKIEDHVKNLVTRKMRKMILEARSSAQDLIGNGDDGPDCSRERDAQNSHPHPHRFIVRDPRKVLIRLRVEYDGFPAFNPQRYGAEFVGEIANPTDAVLLSKKKKDQDRRAVEGEGEGDRKEDYQQIFNEGGADEINKIKVEDLVNETLANSRESLTILSMDEMAQALGEFVDKKNASAILDLVNGSLERTQRALNLDKSAEDKATIVKAAEAVKKMGADLPKGQGTKRGAVDAVYGDSDLDIDSDTREGKGAGRNVMDVESEQEDAIAEDRYEENKSSSSAGRPSAAPKSRGKSATSASASASKSTRKGSDKAGAGTLESMWGSRSAEEAKSTTESRRRPSRSTAKVNYALADGDDSGGDALDEDEADADNPRDAYKDDSDVEEEEEEEVEEEFEASPPKKKGSSKGRGAVTKRKPAAKKPTAKKSATTLKRSAASSNSRGNQGREAAEVIDIADSNEGDDDIIESEDEDDKGSFVSSRRSVQLSSSSSKGKGKALSSASTGMSSQASGVSAVSGRKRALPMSISQGTGTGTGATKKPPGKKSHLTTGWDD